MRQVTLGGSGITVPDWCLGTMTWGNQTPEADAHRQADLAVEAGLTFWDCAEMYPVNPVRAESWGRSEDYIGSWLAARGGRERLTIATKVAGPHNALRGEHGFGDGQVEKACEASLRRLGTDVIDLYQLHWPARSHYHFRRNWHFRPETDRAAVLAGIDDVLGQLARLVESGKVRAVGLSNETAWGVLAWRARARAAGLPVMETVQNEYSLLCRAADTDLAEVLALEDVALLAFSPLGAGLLTGKYAGGRIPEGSRRALNGDLSGRATVRADAAVAAYHGVARKHGLDPVHMALAWHRSRPVPSVPILGATTAAQLERQIGARDLTLGDEVLEEIDATHRAHPLPF